MAIVNPKQIEDPDNEGQMIDNPDYDPELNEDGSPIEKKEDPDPLAPIKQKLDKAYSKVSDLEAENKKLIKAARDAELERLKGEGKEKEHYEGRIADLESENESLKARIVELTRDNEVQRELSAYTFKSKRSGVNAHRDIIDELVQDDKGNWMHSSGKSISDFVKTFADDPDNSYLFKEKESKGTHLQNKAKPNPDGTGPRKLKDMPQEQVLRLAAEGKLP